ncbi:MAG: hypothetical protein D8M57_06945 [Candidatus Scalindua sp. AMX11]|nr:MAG: hypothetical protein DWQ00_14515 [Candidatus Scalindua sp.]TDE65624.1 MAG: hypothetical protein D8M57_06945 [Candidatus Scalindua sp. AMX11]
MHFNSIISCDFLMENLADQWYILKEFKLVRPEPKRIVNYKFQIPMFELSKQFGILCLFIVVCLLLGFYYLVLIRYT